MSRDIPPLLWRALEDARDAFAPEGEAGIGIPRITRRDFLKLGAAAAALASAGCQGPTEEIVPTARARDIPPGVPRFYATSLVQEGFATGVLVATHEGRPTKVEGNPLHPASLGGSGPFEQAAVLDFWDPARSRSVLREGTPAGREALAAALRERVAKLEARGGEGLRILARYSSSPTWAARLAALQSRWPALRVHTWEPLHRDRSLAGARLAFGRAVDPVLDLSRADVVVSFDRDLLGEGPGWLRYARDGIARRRPSEAGPMSRLHAFECAPSLTGATADHRQALRPEALAHALAALAAALKGERIEDPVVTAAARDLAAHRGRGLVVAGERLPPEAHALVHAINATLGNAGQTVRYLAPVTGDVDCTESIRTLADDMRAGRVDTLLILGGNPVYDAPADIVFVEALGRVPWSLHLASREDETSAHCTWHVPRTHAFEHWSDARAFDGTASIVQPLASPLHGAMSDLQLLALLEGRGDGDRDLVRAQWDRAGDDAAWSAMLRDGLVPDSAATPLALMARDVAFTPPAESAGWSLVLAPDASARDGEWAHNAWLQELPRPHTKLTWDNAAFISPDAAADLGVKTGDLLALRVREHRVEAPAWILPGAPARTVILPLGLGRTAGGEVGRDVGVDGYPLRSTGAPWSVEGVVVEKAPGRHEFATTQNHARMEGRDPVQRVSAAEAQQRRTQPKSEGKTAPSLYPEWRYDSYRWGMVVDLTACIGCNACTIACQAENNIPTVGKEEVARGREMHWIRVDRYYEGDAAAPRTHFQPVPCMHCEEAPCEPVCPVGATMHDSEGLNVQVYNRCVGTRFCSNNCPYKVRRFNFLHYNARPEAPPLEARNPDVTVRMRGVMEKCNYCLQRITRARIAADRDGRRIGDGDVVTACQSACPTRAITFGDLSDGKSAVSKARADGLNYTLLEELNTRPRTTYLARVSNPSDGDA